MFVRRLFALLPFVTCLAAMSGCGDHSSSGTDALPPAEIFNFGGQPISISSPPKGWRRDKAQSGGLRGVRFIKTGSIGEEIRIAEHYALDDRDRCAEFTLLLRDFDNLDRKEFVQRLRKTALYASPPINKREQRRADLANARLNEAREAFLNDDPEAARVDTWDRLNHTQRKRHVFILNNGNLLVIGMGLGRFAEMEKVFDTVVASLRFL